MEEKNVNKVYYGICRCCLTNGFHKDMAKEYGWNGIREVYADIMKDTYDIDITNYKGTAKLICTTCIQKLRDASNFKISVISSQQQFLDILDDRGTEFINVEEQSLEVKAELVKVELDDHLNDEFDSLNDDFINVALSNSPIDNKNEESIDDNTEDTFTEKQRILLKRFEKLPFKPLPKQSILPKAPPLTFTKKFSKKDNRHITKSLQDHTNGISLEDISNQITEKNAHIQNVSTVLRFSNATPFKSKSFHGYPCFYCRHAFNNPNELREHVANTHKNVNIKTMLWKYGAECLVVYVDVTDLQCSLCNLNIPKLNDLKKHLINFHKKIMCLEYTDRIIPFKLTLENSYECQVCTYNFETFGSIERHMNTHYRNYICKECGGGFVTKYRLKTHIKNMHKIGYYLCEICNKLFATHQRLKNHIDSVHKLAQRFKCPYCKERFTEYFKRQRHLVQIHNAAPIEYKCNVCDKVFDRRYTLSRHLKKDHLEERDFQCDVCPYRCFTKSELQVHMVKHGGERIFECKICKKAYARKKTLKEHMRIHNDDRRFTCTACGQAFIQKCSLKGHVKTHHPELNELQ